MGLSNWFRGRREPPPPEDLLAALLSGFERKDYDGLMHLINGNAETIRAQFRSWTKAPEAVTADPAALEHYVNTLVTIARVFAQAGDPSLYDLITGKGRDNPIAQWQTDCERADQLIDGGQPAEAAAILRAALESMRQASGTGVDYWRPRALGRLGHALAKLGDLPEAGRVTREALELCRLAGDAEGVQVYTTNLNELGTYEVIGAGDDGRSIVVFIDEQGQTLTPEELPRAVGTVRWEMRGIEAPPPDAARLRDEGRTAGERGDHAEAIALFTQAAELAPKWPAPVYDRAFTYLLEQDFGAALADYRKTLDLSPRGYFVAAQAADMLAREEAGEFPPGSYLAFALLEHAPREEKRAILEEVVQELPSHAPAWEAYAALIEDPAKLLAAVEQGLGACPDPYTLGMLLVRQALALNGLGRTEEAVAILQRLVESPGELLNTHAVAYLALAAIRGQPRG
jgi:tetratricopeptide (TPR) repeat protein